MQAESVHLSFKQGSADKVYNAELKESGDGWLVNFSYGRRGKPLRSGTKTANPLPYDQAKRAYDKLVTSKTAKGYTPDGSGTPFTAPQIDSERTGWIPQLLNPVEDEDILTHFGRLQSDVIVQTKHDGERRAVIYQNGELYGANRRGLKVPLHPTIQKALERVIEFGNLGDFILDGEDMGEYIWFFDCCQWDGEDTRNLPFMKRIKAIHQLQFLANEAGLLDAILCDVGIRATHHDTVIEFYLWTKDKGEEGMVMKGSHEPYTEGRPNSGGPALKIKHYATATCRVASVHPTKRSIGLELADETGMFDFVGNCTIPPNYEIPSVGELVEIKYLYAYRNGSIYQPQYKGVRTDLDDSAATTRQLKYKE